MTAKGLAGVSGALSTWWYALKVGLISKTIRQCWQARGLQEEIKRLRSSWQCSTHALWVLSGLSLLRCVLC
jgi:hypothetical protein